MSLSAIIIDDEKFARDDLANLLLAHPEIAVIGEAGSIADAKSLLLRVTPDVVFLDIRLQGSSGFELVSHIPPISAIIFFTAHDIYAVRAFEVNALDYLLKPVTAERMAAAIERLHKRRSQPPEAQDRSSDSLKDLKPEDHIFIRTRSELQFIQVETIVAITASGGNYTTLHLENGKHPLIRRTMKVWGRVLPNRLFFRIHRSAIINLDRFHRLKREANGSFSVYLSGLTEPFEVSRRALTHLKQFLPKKDTVFS